MNNLVMTKAAKQAIAKAKEMGLTITSAYRSSAEDKRVGGTGTGDHTKGLALDVAGSVSKMNAYAKWAKESKLFRIVLWQVADHYDHVHVAWVNDGSKSDGTLSFGDSGLLVTIIQKLLGGLNNKGYFGKDTEAAVKEFQRNRGLEVDGIVGQKTWDKLSGGAGLFFSKRQ